MHKADEKQLKQTWQERDDVNSRLQKLVDNMEHVDCFTCNSDVDQSVAEEAAKDSIK